MTDQERLMQIMGDIPEDTRRFVRKSMDIADRITSLLEEQGKTQKDLAKALGKAESEISKWLSGQHNFTMRTLTTIEEALGENILVVPGGKRQEKYYPQTMTSQKRPPKKPGMTALLFAAKLSAMEFSTDSAQINPTLLPQSPGFKRVPASKNDKEMVVVG